MPSSVSTHPSLLEAMVGGRDDRAWRDFFRAYAPMFLAIAKGQRLSDADADDIVARTVTAVHRYFSQLEGSFDHTKGKFRAWLYGVVRNQIRDARRRAQRRARHEGPLLLDDQPDPRDEAEFGKTFELEWQRNLLTRALEEAGRCMKPSVFQAFQLYALEHKPVGAVARLLGIAPGTVYVNKRRTLLELRRIVQRLQQEEE